MVWSGNVDQRQLGLDADGGLIRGFGDAYRWSSKREGKTTTFTHWAASLTMCSWMGGPFLFELSIAQPGVDEVPAEEVLEAGDTVVVRLEGVA